MPDLLSHRCSAALRRVAQRLLFQICAQIRASESAAPRGALAVLFSHMATYTDDNREVARPLFVEPRRALQKAMARRAKTSHLGAFQILPEHVLLSCLARLPREDHDAVADCSTGFRALMRSERFLKARRAEDISRRRRSLSSAITS